MQLTVLFFASLRDEAHCSKLSYVSEATTALDLYEELRAKYSFTLMPKNLLVAINLQYSSFSTPLKEGDTVAFIPPVAGG